MKSSDIILAMQAANDPVRLDQLRKKRRARIFASVLGPVVLVAIILLATCSG